jgi:hypothetical protein
VLKEDDDDDDDDDDEFAVHTKFTFSIQLKILNILHPQPEINLPVALFKLATTLAANGVCMYICDSVAVLHMPESDSLHFVMEERTQSIRMTLSVSSVLQ